MYSFVIRVFSCDFIKMHLQCFITTYMRAYYGAWLLDDGTSVVYNMKCSWQEAFVDVTGFHHIPSQT